MRAGLIKKPVIDKNGKRTTVWVKGSKVFHGTGDVKSVVQALKDNTFKYHKSAGKDTGMYVSTDEVLADKYAKDTGKQGAGVVTININEDVKLIDFSSAKEQFDDFMKFKRESGLTMSEATEKYNKHLIDQGYDGVKTGDDVVLIFKESIGKVGAKDGLDKFLEGSVVKDVVYHATRSDFNSFDNIKQELGTHVGTMRQARDRAEVGRIRLTSDKFLYTSNTSIMPLYISIKNPLELTDNGGFKFIDIGKQLIDRGVITKRDWESIISSNNEHMYDPLLKKLLKEKGYDSIKYLNRFEGLLNEEYTNENFAKINSVNRMNLSDKDFKKRFPLAEYSYIVFDAGRIKSATGNDGNFDPTKPDITKAE